MTQGDISVSVYIRVCMILDISYITLHIRDYCMMSLRSQWWKKPWIFTFFKLLQTASSSIKKYLSQTYLKFVLIGAGFPFKLKNGQIVA